MRVIDEVVNFVRTEQLGSQMQQSGVAPVIQQHRYCTADPGYLADLEFRCLPVHAAEVEIRAVVPDVVSIVRVEIGISNNLLGDFEKPIEIGRDLRHLPIDEELFGSSKTDIEELLDLLIIQFSIYPKHLSPEYAIFVVPDHSYVTRYEDTMTKVPDLILHVGSDSRPGTGATTSPP